ncbi:MAG: O-methyltransferase family protein [Bacteroidales bacterium]|nr:MAG: O-methyltransferase family protein [Bacteroidales bacterium]
MMKSLSGMDYGIDVPRFPPARLVKLTDCIKNFLVKTARRMGPSNLAVFELTQNIWIIRAIGVAVELEIADILSGGPKTVSELAVLTKSNPDNLYRLMRALASQGIFRETGNRTFRMTPLASGLKEGKGSMKNMIAHQLNPTNWQMIGEMTYCVRTGKDVAEKILGSDIFEYLKKYPEKNRLYNLAMTDTSNISSATVLSAYNFSGVKKLVDIGGGHGFLLSIIMHKYPELQGVIFDLPHVVKGANETIKKMGIENRVSIVPGNFFETVPEGGDTYILKSIIHAFDDEKCISLLQNIYKAMVDKGKLLIVEVVLPEDNSPSFGKIFDLQMLIGAPGGKERTRKEFEYILSRSGFKLKRIIPTVSPFCILESLKL